MLVLIEKKRIHLPLQLVGIKNLRSHLLTDIELGVELTPNDRYFCSKLLQVASLRCFNVVHSVKFFWNMTCSLYLKI